MAEGFGPLIGVRLPRPGGEHRRGRPYGGRSASGLLGPRRLRGELGALGGGHLADDERTVLHLLTDELELLLATGLGLALHGALLLLLLLLLRALISHELRRIVL